MANSAKYIVNEKVSLKFDQKVVLMTLSTTHGKTRLNMQRIYLYLSSIYRHSGIIHLIICLTLNNSGKLETDFQNFGNRSLAPLSNLIHRWRCSLVFAIFYKFIFFFYRRKLHRLCPLGRQLTRLPPHLHPIQEQRDPSDEVLA